MKVLIALSTYNRPVITRICLENLAPFRSADVKLVVYDDASDAYDKAYLSGYADEVIRFQSNGGIARSRAKTMRDFVYRHTDFDILYLTDNDTVHDPEFLPVLRSAFARQAGSETPLPVSLFNSRFHSAPERVLGEATDFLFTKNIPGVSQGYDRRLARLVVDALNVEPELEFSAGWDWHYVTVLNRPCALSRTSYLEHFARDRLEGGMHQKSSGLGEAGLVDFEVDRAVNPTAWLAGIRPQVIDKLLF
ncbi:MAG TPA: glycosyltransferase family 2 protein [Caulobacteraceae bacterium]|jgi:hypothetical protein|nr:glycosyltransferase family 2 protein [Caulobacteraceae bacterium]